MIQPNQQHRYLLIHCVFLFTLVHFTSAQVCQNDVPDFFYNVSFVGPLFDQSVYTVITSNFSVSSSNGTVVFPFKLQPQSSFTRPSFVPTSVTGRALNNTAGIVRVSSTNPSFGAALQPDGSYNLITTTA